MPEAGWYPDPIEPDARARYWDGIAWATQTIPLPGIVAPGAEDQAVAKVPLEPSAAGDAEESEGGIPEEPAESAVASDETVDDDAAMKAPAAPTMEPGPSEASAPVAEANPEVRTRQSHRRTKVRGRHRVIAGVCVLAVLGITVGVIAAVSADRETSIRSSCRLLTNAQVKNLLHFGQVVSDPLPDRLIVPSLHDELSSCTFSPGNNQVADTSASAFLKSYASVVITLYASSEPFPNPYFHSSPTTLRIDGQSVLYFVGRATSGQHSSSNLMMASKDGYTVLVMAFSFDRARQIDTGAMADVLRVI